MALARRPGGHGPHEVQSDRGPRWVCPGRCRLCAWVGSLWESGWEWPYLMSPPAAVLLFALVPLSTQLQFCVVVALAENGVTGTLVLGLLD